VIEFEFESKTMENFKGSRKGDGLQEGCIWVDGMHMKR
jgi:hypothetical protein